MSASEHAGAGRWDGGRVKALRARFDLPLVDFAALVGVRGSTVSRWEAGTTHPTRLAVRRLEELEREAQNGS